MSSGETAIVGHPVDDLPGPRTAAGNLFGSPCVAKQHAARRHLSVNPPAFALSPSSTGSPP
ncbi:MAG: hypothetical protein U0792_16220 [Gemmataceae bacterium]